MAEKKIQFIMYCPRCDRPYTSTKSAKDVEDDVKKHVSQQHPDHDPEWYDTHPTND